MIPEFKHTPDNLLNNNVNNKIGAPCKIGAPNNHQYLPNLYIL